jgi:hypothetical protein
VQARSDAVGDHARLVAETRWRRASIQTSWKQQTHAIWPAEVQVVADHRFEEVTTVHGRGKDLGQAHFELPDAQAVAVAGGTIGWREWPGQPRKPAVEEGLDVGRAE